MFRAHSFLSTGSTAGAAAGAGAAARRPGSPQTAAEWAQQQAAQQAATPLVNASYVPNTTEMLAGFSQGLGLNVDDVNKELLIPFRKNFLTLLTLRSSKRQDFFYTDEALMKLTSLTRHQAEALGLQCADFNLKLEQLISYNQSKGGTITAYPEVISAVQEHIASYEPQMPELSTTMVSQYLKAL